MAKEIGLTFSSLALISAAGTSMALAIGLGRAQKNGVVGVSLDMLLEILGSLESLATEVALMRLQWDMHPDVGRDVIAFDGSCAAVPPLAS